MDDTSTGLSFEERGIASALSHRILRVPLNQRSYAWEKDEVTTLLDDLYRAFDAGEPIYFLGAIVLTRGANKQWEVADGQQRLATTSILIAAVRDYLLELEDDDGAKKFQSTYLLDYDVRKKDSTAKLYLNYQDHEFFLATILKAPKDREPFSGQSFDSHELLAEASKLARAHVRNMVAALPYAEKANRLYDWIDFLSDAAKVIVIMVPGKVGNAFKMFETLNARGMEASKTDILKNFLFDLSQARIAEVHTRWMSMLSTIEGAGEDALLVKFVRHYWITQQGPTTDRDLGDAIERSIKTERQAFDMVMALDSYAADYVALLAPRDHARWNEFNRPSRDAIYTVTRELGGEQIRPLMLAVARSFSVQEAEKAFQKMVSWAVRFLIAGGGGGGVMDRSYGMRARDVTRGTITTAAQLSAEMAGVIPSDTLFQSAFSTANVRKTNLARYYLRALELHVKAERNPQFLPSDDTAAVNLEHILPVNPSPDWDISQEAAAVFHKRLGNMVLLGSKQNVEIGNSRFLEKRSVFAASPFVLTTEVAKNELWGAAEIEARQHQLAELAPKVWPL
ncbi:DUF262 domain-containing HNH endonuclease family protein [Mesorhizobium sp. M0510]|uniref:DUF262 domain-containing protein n=1 Tax=unclassified Mesorhizobium TaxID=325217 RepID=UPI00333B8AAB